MIPEQCRPHGGDPRVEIRPRPAIPRARAGPADPALPRLTTPLHLVVLGGIGVKSESVVQPDARESETGGGLGVEG